MSAFVSTSLPYAEEARMFKSLASRGWTITLLALLIVLAGCKNGSGGGGGY